LSGQLRNSRGTKVCVYLLDTALVVGRPVSRPGVGRVVQVYRDPIPMDSLRCQDLADGEAVKPGSFHRSFSNQGGSKNAFRVWSEIEDGEKSHSLSAPDEHIKKQWVTIIQKTIASLTRSETDNNSISVISSTPKQRGKLQKKLSGGEVLSSLTSRSSSRLKQSTPRLLSASRLLSPSGKIVSSPTGRTGIFRKKMSPKLVKSPVIKSSLSQSALTQLQAGGVKKVTRKLKRRSDEENRYSNIVMDGRQLMKEKVARRAKSAAVLQILVRKRKPAEKRMLALIDENLRPMSKSMAHLALSPMNNLSSSPRYLTRRAAKLSKSMNDLLEL